MVITIELENYVGKKVLIDQGSSVNILYWATYQKLQLLTTAMVPYDEPIYGFSREKVSTRGYIDLHTVFRDDAQTKTIPICFLVVDAPTSYNVLLGRPSLNTLGAVVSTPHLAMKFSSPSGDILTIHGDKRLARECYMASLRPQLPILQTNHIERPPDSIIALSGDDLDPKVGRMPASSWSKKLYHWNSLMDVPSNSALAYNPNTATSLHPPSLATQTCLPGQPPTYPALTLKSHPTNSPFTRRQDMSPRKNENLVKNVD